MVFSFRLSWEAYLSMQPIFFENTLILIRWESRLFNESELWGGIESLSLLRNRVGVWSLCIIIVIKYYAQYEWQLIIALSKIMMLR